MFIAPLFTIANIWRQPECASTDERAQKMWHAWSCYISLLTEPRVHKAWAGKLGGSRSRRNCRQVYSLQAGAAAILQPCCIPWWLTQRTQPKCSVHGFSGRAYIYLQSKSGLWPSRYILTHMHSAIVISAVTWPCIYKMWQESKKPWGGRAWPPPFYLICSFPTYLYTYI